MLEVFSDSILNGVDKGLGLTQASVKEVFKFFPSDRNVSLIFYLPLVLLPAKQGGIFEKGSAKWYPILIFGPGRGKIVLTLLEEVIALQVSFIPIYIWKPRF